MTASLSHGVAVLVLQFAGAALVLVAVVAVGRRASDGQLSRRSLVAIGLALLIGVAGLIHIHGAASVLVRARHDRVSALLGREHCVTESVTGAPVSLRAIGFLSWVRRQLPAGAHYGLAGYNGSPDPWCLTTILLPALPGPHPGWALALGSIPAEMKAKIARHDPQVSVYSPGYALERDPRS